MWKLVFIILFTTSMVVYGDVSKKRACTIDPFGNPICDNGETPTPEPTVEPTTETNIVVPEDVTIIVDEEGTKTAETKEKELADGSTSKTKVEVKKDGESKSTISVKNPITGEVEDTTVSTPTGTNIQIKESGEVVQTFETKTVKSEVTAGNDGKVNAKIDITSGEKREINVPSGSTTSITSDGSTTAINQVETDEGEVIQTQIDSNSEGNLEAIAISPEINERVSKLSSGKILAKYSARREFSNVKIDVLFNQSNKRVKKISSGQFVVEFTARREFSYKYEILSNNRELIDGENITIIPDDENTIFQETQTFNGIRTIKVISGGATLRVDSNDIEMEVNKEYELPAIKVKKIDLSNGWNLISLPVDVVVDKNQEVSEKDGIYNFTTFGSYENMKFFRDSKWISSVDKITKGEGFWIKTNAQTNLTFSGYEYLLSSNNLNIGWNLVGSGKDINTTDFKSKYSIGEIFKYNSLNSTWVTNPTEIKAGEGYWAKKVENEEVFKNNKLTLFKGWNLISLPINTTMEDFSIFGSLKLFKFENGKWVDTPNTLTKGEGVWVQVDSDKNIEFEGDTYSINLTSLSGWNLIGTGENISNANLVLNGNEFWTFNPKYQMWIKNPDTIYRGQGIWYKN